MKKKNLLVTLADENYIDQAKQLFSSVYWNAGWKGDYMLLAHEVPEKKLKWFRNKGILVKKCVPFYHREGGVYPETILSKFYLFTPEFKKWENIVYLDADIIVKASLDELIKVRGLGACNHGKISKMLQFSCRKLHARNKEAIENLKKNYNLKEPGFNTGVIAFNSEVIEKKTFSELNRLVGLYGMVTDFKEQLALSLFFYKKFSPLPRTYNCWVDYMVYSCNIKPQEIKCIILHFMAVNKPWQKKSPFYEEWKNNLNKAELINLRKVPEGKKYSEDEIKNYEAYLKKKHSRFKHFIWKTSIFIEKYIGLVGLFLNKNHPQLYFNLKKLKDKK